RVADDGVRGALSDAIDVVRSLIEPAPDGPTSAAELDEAPEIRPAAVQRLARAVEAMDAAQVAVTAARTTWQAEQDAAAAQAEAAAQAQAEAEAARQDQAPALGGPPSTGAGPDCGGPD